MLAWLAHESPGGVVHVCLEPEFVLREERLGEPRRKGTGSAPEQRSRRKPKSNAAEREPVTALCDHVQAHQLGDGERVHGVYDIGGVARSATSQSRPSEARGGSR